MTSPYKFYQFWLNVEDKELKSLTRYFSLESREVIEKREEENAENPNALKALLAKELTIRIHGQAAFESAKNVSEILFNAKASKEQLLSLSAAELKLIAGEIPSFSIDQKILNGDISLIDLLAEHTNIVASKSEARRAIQSNAISLNKDKVSDLEAQVNRELLLHGQYFMVENGKKNKFIISVTSAGS